MGAHHLNKPIFQDADEARKWLETKLWAQGRPCPHCGVIDGSILLQGKSTRPGLYKCKACSKQFTVTVGTIFERSHIPLNKWLQIVFLMCASKKGMSAHQIHRMVGLTYKSAWFACHRIREAMRSGELAPMGGAGEIVEVDETYIGNKRERTERVRGDGKVSKARGWGHKHAVLSLVQRGGGVRSFHVENASVRFVEPIVKANIARESQIETDESMIYRRIGKHFAGGHFSVNHSQEEWARDGHSTNTIEGYFSIFKRGMRGVYQHCGEQHLHRYLAEFDFRYNNRAAMGIDDSERTEKAVVGIVGRRLTYKGTDRSERLSRAFRSTSLAE